VTGLLAERAPGLLKTLCEHDRDFVPLDETLAECDSVGDTSVPILADRAHQGAGPWSPPASNDQSRMTVITKAVLTRERQR
jgi:hypothetical protein